VWVGVGIFGLFISLAFIGMLLPARQSGPELLATGIIGCQRQDVAVAIARTLSARHGAESGMGEWAEKNGCQLVPAGTSVTPIEEEAGHPAITKVSINGSDRYLLGLPRPTSQEKLDDAVRHLKEAVHGG
jgi:hypothetical protein